MAFASNGLTALDILHGLYGEPHTPDCVLLDLCMPQFDGFEFMRAKNSDKTVRVIPVIVMTALNVNSEKVKAIEGARAIMQKPYDMDELFATIREALN